MVVKLQKTNITAKKIQRMEEAGHPPIKIKFKRLANLTTKSQTVSQPESSDHQPHRSASSPPATHETNELVGDCPHPIPRDHTVGSQMVETMLVDQLLQPGSGILPHYGSHKETRIQATDTTAEGIATHRGKTGTPDSTTDRPLACDTDEEGPDTHESLTHTRANQAHNKGCISSSYADIELEI